MLTWQSDDEDEALAGAVYSPGLADALAGVSGNSIGQWARHDLIRATLYQGPPVNLPRHAGAMSRRRPGDPFTHTGLQRHRAPPSLASTLRRSSSARVRRSAGG